MTDEAKLEAVPDQPAPDDDDLPELAGAPVMPWAINLNSCTRHWSRAPNGGIRLHLTVAQPTREGYMLMAPQIIVPFSGEGFAEFQREVANGGVKAPVIETATVVPDPPRRVH